MKFEEVVKPQLDKVNSVKFIENKIYDQSLQKANEIRAFENLLKNKFSSFMSKSKRQTLALKLKGMRRQMINDLTKLIEAT